MGTEPEAPNRVTKKRGMVFRLQVDHQYMDSTQTHGNARAPPETVCFALWASRQAVSFSPFSAGGAGPTSLQVGPQSGCVGLKALNPDFGLRVWTIMVLGAFATRGPGRIHIPEFLSGTRILLRPKPRSRAPCKP